MDEVNSESLRGGNVCGNMVLAVSTMLGKSTRSVFAKEIMLESSECVGKEIDNETESDGDMKGLLDLGPSYHFADQLLEEGPSIMS